MQTKNIYSTVTAKRLTSVPHVRELCSLNPGLAKFTQHCKSITASTLCK